MRENGSRKRKIVKIATAVLLMVFIVVSALVLLQNWEKTQGMFPTLSPEDTTVEHNGKEYVLNPDVDTLLVLGLDKYMGVHTGASYNNDKQADFLMLLVFNNKEKTTTAIHINRDTMARVNVLAIDGIKVINTVTKQIALSHTYGNGKEISCRNTADSVSELLYGMQIDHFISLTMDSVGIYNDLVGGVEVTVLDDFKGIDDTLVKGEKVLLKNKHALNYVRTRYGLDDSTNNNRMNRQQQYVNALFEKSKKITEKDDQFIIDASLKMADYIVSDRSVTQLQELAKKIDDYKFMGIKTIKGESKKGEEFIEFYPDNDDIKNLVIELFYIPAR
jgi:LCP family protein required for cell wall assembly